MKNKLSDHVIKYGAIVLAFVLLAMIFIIWPSLLKNIWGLIFTPLVVLVLGLVIEYRVFKPMEQKKSLDQSSSVQANVTKGGASAFGRGSNGIGSASSFGYTIGGSTITTAPGEFSLEITDAEGHKKVYRESGSGYRYESRPRSFFSAEAHTGNPILGTLASLDENQANNLSQNIARQHLQPREYLIRAIVGHTNLDLGNEGIKSLVEGISTSSEQWYCVALTQSNLVLIKLDYYGKTLDVRRYPFSQIRNVLYRQISIAAELDVNFRTGDSMKLEVVPSFRKQAQDIVSVLAHYKKL
jgi:hypothetical protein